MPALVPFLLLLSLAAGFLWPGRKTALLPIAVVIGLTAFFVVHGDWRVSPNGDNTSGLQFFALVVIALLGEGAIIAGALLRAARERRRGEVLTSRLAVRGGAGAAAVSLSFVCVIALLDRGAIDLEVLLVGALAAGAWWFARRGSE